MQEINISQKVEELLSETANEHHIAFKETDGTDPEWPMWYAGYLKEKLVNLFNTEITKSELIFLLISVENKKAKSKSKKSWQKYYADFLTKRFS